MIKKRKGPMKAAAVLLCAALACTLVAGTGISIFAEEVSWQEKIFPASVTTLESVSLGNISLPASPYGNLVWVDPSIVPSSYSGSYEVKLVGNGAMDLSGIPGYRADTGAVYGYVTVYVQSLAEPSPVFSDVTAQEAPAFSDATSSEESASSAEKEREGEESQQQEESEEEEDGQEAEGEDFSEDSEGAEGEDFSEGGEDIEGSEGEDSEGNGFNEVQFSEDGEDSQDWEEDDQSEAGEDEESEDFEEEEEEESEDENSESGGFEENGSEDGESEDDWEDEEDSDDSEGSEDFDDATDSEDSDSDDSEEEQVGSDFNQDLGEDDDPFEAFDPDEDITPVPTWSEGTVGGPDDPFNQPDIFDNEDFSGYDGLEDLYDETDEEDEEQTNRFAQAAHTCGGITVSGSSLPWYVTLQVSGSDSDFLCFEGADIYQAFNLSLYDTRTGGEYIVPDGEYVTVSMPVKRGYNYVVEHHLASGGIETIIPTLYDNVLAFSTHSFSPFGIAGSNILVGPTEDETIAAPVEVHEEPSTEATTAAQTVRQTNTGSNNNTSTQTSTNENGGAVKRTNAYVAGPVSTGDETNPVAYLALLASGLGLLIVTIKMKVSHT